MRPALYLGSHSAHFRVPTSGSGKIRQLESAGTYSKRTYSGRRIPQECTSNASNATVRSLAGPFPFAVGPMYLLSRSLVQLAFMRTVEVARLIDDQPFACRAEDAMVGYAVHLAGYFHGLTLEMVHLTWAKLHNFHARRVSLTYRVPDEESLVVHNLKCSLARAALWAHLRKVVEVAAQDEQPSRSERARLVRFRWTPRTQIMRCLDSGAWSRQTRKLYQLMRTDPSRLLQRSQPWVDVACPFLMNQSGAKKWSTRGKARACGTESNNNQLCF
mmetsp:Transcript_25685/g.65278  ORF Transcript_25685/g.65278 Transcript_25685/m.65278 type:complete len:273 (+) Transcript_25685:623-1441(+)